MIVWTSTIAYEGEDRFDITRGSGGASGHPFAPPEELFRRMILRRAKLQRRAVSYAASAIEAERSAWEDYARQYRSAMMASQKTHHDDWDALLGKSCVTLVCYCTSPARCHRSLLSQILAELGATAEGER